MSSAIARGGSNSVATPWLDLWTPAPDGLLDTENAPIPPGELVTPAAITFAVFDISTDEKRNDPLQVFPAGSGVATLDLVADQIGPGHFAPRFSIASDEVIGAHEIHYFVQLDPSGPILESRVEFDVMKFVGGLGLQGYALVSDLRAEGLKAEKHSDARVMRGIREAKRYIDFVTKRVFTPYGATIRLDGTNTRYLNLQHPMIGIASAATVQIGGSLEPLSLDGLRLYSRHLSQNLLEPDDRDSPRIEWIQQQPFLLSLTSGIFPATQSRSGVWPRGTQNILLEGVFGYTDPDGSLTGCTPDIARRATMLLVLRNLPKLTDVDARLAALNQNRVKSEKTREQSYELFAAKGPGSFTGDPEIDDLLEMLCTPITLASV